jgi:hypothetical protein
MWTVLGGLANIIVDFITEWWVRILKRDEGQ